MTSAVIDYETTYLYFQLLDKIHGEPSHESPKKLKTQLKTNAKPISSDFGGGEHGHLGLVLSLEEYELFWYTSMNALHTQDP